MEPKWHRITEEDIQSVPKAKIFGNEIDKYIQHACKEVLRASLNRTDGFQYDEVAIIIDKNGKHRLLKTGNNGRVDSWDDDYTDLIVCADELSLIFVHNHPNNSKLSFADLINLIPTATMLGVIAVSNSGNVSYAIKIERDHDKYYKLYNYIVSRTNKFSENKISQFDAGNKILNNPTAFGLKTGYSRRRRSK